MSRIAQKFLTMLLIPIFFTGCKQEHLIVCECPPSERPVDSRCPACKVSNGVAPSKRHSTRVLLVSTEDSFNDDLLKIQTAVSQKTGECADVRSLVNTTASKENIGKSIEWLSCGDSPDNSEDGLSVLYISSHGSAKDGISYLKPHGLDAEQAQDVNNLINSDDIFIKPLQQMDKSCPNRKYLVILDSCYSAGMLSWLPPSNICDGSDKNAHLYSRLRVITSSRADQMSSAQDLEPSLFTKALTLSLGRIPQDSTTEDVWISVRSILHMDPAWPKLMQEPAIFTCPHSRLTPFLSSLPRNNLESPIQPRVAAFRQWRTNGKQMVLETDHCAKIVKGSELSARTIAADRFVVEKSVDTPLSNSCVVSVKKIEGTDNGIPNHQTRNEYDPGILFYIKGEKPLEQSIIVDLPADKKKEGNVLFEGIQSVPELALMTDINKAKAQGYYRLEDNLPIKPNSAWWSQEISTSKSSGPCDSILPDSTPVHLDNQSGQINLLRDAVKLYQIRFWESVKAPEVSASFPAELAIYKQGKDTLIGTAISRPNCMEAIPGKYSLRLIGKKSTEAKKRRFVYLCMINGYNRNRPQNEAFPAAQMLFPHNQRQENQALPSRSGVQEVVLADLDLQSGDSKLFTLITSASPRSADLCRQGPILYRDRSMNNKFDLTLNEDRQEYRRFIETNLESPSPHHSSYRDRNVRFLSGARLGLSVAPQLAGEEEETLQRLWIKVR